MTNTAKITNRVLENYAITRADEANTMAQLDDFGIGVGQSITISPAELVTLAAASGVDCLPDSVMCDDPLYQPAERTTYLDCDGTMRTGRDYRAPEERPRDFFVGIIWGLAIEAALVLIGLVSYWAWRLAR